MIHLIANYSMDNLPEKFQNVFGSPIDLYEALENLEKSAIKISNKKELILLIPIVKAKK